MNAIKILALAATIVLLGACGGGGGGGSTGNADATGIWSGTLTVGEDIFEVVGLIHGSQLRFISLDAGAVYEGMFIIDGQDFNASTSNYVINGVRFSESEITGTIVGGESISATFISDDSQEGAIQLAYDPITDRGSSLEMISDSWVEAGFGQAITIDENGVIFGSATNGCTFNGQVSILNQAVNIYAIELDVSGCILSGEYTGFAVVADENEENDLLLFTVSDEDANFVGMLIRTLAS